MKVRINVFERYPVYSLNKDKGDLSISEFVVEVDRDLYNRYLKAAEEYNAVQDILAQIADKVGID